LTRPIKVFNSEPRFALKSPVAVAVFRAGGYLLAAVLDHGGDLRLLGTSTVTMLLGRRAGDHEGFAELGNVLFAKPDDRQPTDLLQAFAIRKAKAGTSMAWQGDRLYVNVLGKAVLAFDFDW
jgi:hypothetical protein